MRGKLVWSVLAGLACGPFTFAQDLIPVGLRGNKPVAVVNGAEIPRPDYDAALRRLPPAPPSLSADQKKAAHMEVLGMMIDDVLLRQYVAKNAPSPTPDAVNKRFSEVEMSLKASKRTLADYYKENNINEATLKAGITAEIGWQNLLATKVTPEQLKKYYEENKEMFDGVKVHVYHIAVPVPPNDPKKEADGKIKLEAVRAEILKGSIKLTDAAQKYSEERSSGDKGGDLGWFPPRKTDGDPFVRTFSTMNPGEISQVTRTGFGLHLIFVSERAPGKSSTFEEVKEAVRDCFADEFKLAIIMEQRKVAKIEVFDP